MEHRLIELVSSATYFNLCPSSLGVEQLIDEVAVDVDEGNEWLDTAPH